jgi:hypothetical protein
MLAQVVPEVRDAQQRGRCHFQEIAPSMLLKPSGVIEL